MEAKRDELFELFQKEVDTRPYGEYASWVRGDTTLPDAECESYPTSRCRFFDLHGFVFIPGFADAQTTVPEMKRAMEKWATDDWNPGQKAAVFRTDQKQVTAQGSSDYFLDSASKVHFFAEKDAMDSEGGIKDEFKNDKVAALNKAGHGMHMIDGPFRDYAASERVGGLLRELGWRDPVVPQSMYIFKQPRIGGEVTSHQDSTFLFTAPRQTCIGLWLALDDSTLENGCLWVRPGSHRESVRRQFLRNPRHFGDSLDYAAGGTGGDRSQPQMIFEQRNENGDVTWDGGMPGDSSTMPDHSELYDAGFIPVPCKAGDLLAFGGELDHLSLPNQSSLPRHTFQLHCVEGKGSGIQWSKKNWLQYPSGVPFMKV